MRSGRKANGLITKNAGFSLFELVVFIILTAIIYSVAANRFSGFPEEAERANFIAVVAQIQSGINMEALLGLGSGRSGAIRNLDGINPMELLLSPPSNYLGVFRMREAASVLPRRSWYFDATSQELVYLVNADENVYAIENGLEIPTDEIRFRTVVSYRGGYNESNGIAAEDSGRLQLATEFSETAEGSAGQRERVAGVVLQPVFPFRWLDYGVNLPAAAIPVVSR